MNQFPGTNYHDLNLDWLLQQMKNCLTEWAATKEDWKNLATDNATFKTAIEGEWDDFRDYLTNEYLPEHIEEDVAVRIAEMANDGTLLAIISAGGDDSAIAVAAGDWLSDHITQETGYVIDDTLTVSGAAADAKVTGDEISAVKNQLDCTGEGQQSITISDYPSISCTITADNKIQRSANKYRSRQIPRESYWAKIRIEANNAKSANVTFVTEAIATTPTAGTSISGILATGETGRHIIATGTTETLTIPDDAAYIIIAYTSNDEDVTPSDVTVVTTVGDEIDTLQTAVQTKMNATYDTTLDWAKVFGTDADPTGWTTGYYNSTGAASTTVPPKAIRTYRSSYYTAKEGDVKLRFTVPVGKYAAIIEYDENGENGTSHGDFNSGSNSVEISMTEGHRYKFCAGKWDDSSVFFSDEDPEPLPEMTAVVTRTVIAWQREQDARLDALSGAVAIPDYYNEDSYLQNRISAITTIQKTLSDKTDSFLFVTDYHIRTNRGNSLALMKEVASKTGIEKLFFAGDAGGRYGGAGSGYKEPFQKSVDVWTHLTESVGRMYGVLGNHEWIYHTDDTSSQYYEDSFSLGAMFGGYLNRYKGNVVGMGDSGSYFIEDPVCKIRYYFMQDSYGAAPLDRDWFGKSLENIQNGYYVAVIIHHGFIPGRASYAEYDNVYIEHSDTEKPDGTPDTLSNSQVMAKRISNILEAYRTHTTITISTDTYDFTTTSGGGVIGIFCGHLHHGTLLAIDDTYNDWGFPVWRGGTDSMQAASVSEEVPGFGKVPWYWKDGHIGVSADKVVRAVGTTDEQCFYAVQIDMTAKKVYITAVGGDHDWEFEFN